MSRWRSPLGIFVVACSIALLQLLLVCSVRGFHQWGWIYSHLFEWDSFYYASIVDEGYSWNTVGQFPAYALLGRALQFLLKTPTPISLLLVAQILSIGCWAYVLSFFRHFRTPRAMQVGIILGLLAHPGAFFLLTAYSESTFLFATLGFLYWSLDDRRYSPLLAAAHGVLMTSARIVGIPLVLAPVLLAILRHAAGKESPRLLLRRLRTPLLVTMIALLGAGSFFLYCHMQFGVWNATMIQQRMHWSIEPHYLFFLDVTRLQQILLPLWIGGGGLWNSMQVDLWTTSLTFWLLLLSIVMELLWWGRSELTGRNIRLTFAFCTAAMLYISLAALSYKNMTSMLRYTFPMAVLFGLALGTCIHHLQPRLSVRRLAFVVCAIWVFLGILMQMKFIGDFAERTWVA